jgi:hypothetical protein
MRDVRRKLHRSKFTGNSRFYLACVFVNFIIGKSVVDDLLATPKRLRDRIENFCFAQKSRAINFPLNPSIQISR